MRESLFCVIPGLDPGIQVNRCPVRQHRQQRFVSLRDGLINLGPGVKHRGDRGGGHWGDKIHPSTGVTSIMPAAQGIPACAGMTIEKGAGVTKNTLKHGVTKSMPAPG